MPLPMTLRAAAAALALATVATACGGGDVDTSATPPAPVATQSPGASPTSITGGTGVTINGSGSVPPTSSPGIITQVSQGTASVIVTGDLAATATFGQLTSPAIWSPPPGTLALAWGGAGKQSFAIGGESFASRIVTSPVHSLSLTLRVSAAAVEFRSTAGECSVTINPALPDNMGGNFQCAGIASADGSLRIDAQGTFAATG